MSNNTAVVVEENPFSQIFTYNALAHAVSGWGGGQVAMSLFYPLDQIRTHIQVDPKKGRMNIVEATMSLIEEEGVNGLYTGLGPVLVSLGASNFIYFYSYNALKAFAKSIHKGTPIGTGENLLIAAVAGAINVITTCPLWVANTRLKLQHKKKESGEDIQKPYKGLLNAMYRIYKEEGLGALWDGTYASLILVSNPTIQFVVYDKVKSFMLKRRKNLSTFEYFLLGAFAKAIATIITYPIQIAQTNLRAGKRKGADENAKYKGTVDCLIKMLREGGIVSWFRGLDAKIIQVCLTAAFQFLTYEQIHNFIMFNIMRASPGKKAQGDHN